MPRFNPHPAGRTPRGWISTRIQASLRAAFLNPGSLHGFATCRIARSESVLRPRVRPPVPPPAAGPEDLVSRTSWRQRVLGGSAVALGCGESGGAGRARRTCSLPRWRHARGVSRARRTCRLNRMCPRRRGWNLPSAAPVAFAAGGRSTGAAVGWAGSAAGCGVLGVEVRASQSGPGGGRRDVPPGAAECTLGGWAAAAPPAARHLELAGAVRQGLLRGRRATAPIRLRAAQPQREGLPQRRGQRESLPL